MRTVAEINEKIDRGQVTVWTVAELKQRVGEWGIRRCAETVDVVTTGTYEPMEASAAVLNIGQTDPPLKIRQAWLDGVPAYAGFGAADLMIGASQPTEAEDQERGGGHVIEALVDGRAVALRAVGYQTDCYPRASLETTLTRETVNQFYLYNPRNLYQNFIVGVNGGERTLYTYLGPLLPQLGNAVYASPGALAPLMNDPDLTWVGIGTRIFLGGGEGYIAWEGTQHFPLQKRLENRTPVGPAATVALIGDARSMGRPWVRGCYFKHYGPSLMLGVGVPFPVVDETVIAACAVRDEEVVAPVMDFAIPRRVRPSFGLVTYAQLKSGRITVDGRPVRTAPLASLHLSLKVAETLRDWIAAGRFRLTEPVAALPRDRTFLAQDVVG
ncbi:MAG: homocysteine biosynthesis protein [Gloeomargaritaceae cyanobacterium C42_A2020_066]|nr:homocysteine biosynthesis protein [Gloeomargaritaceae cyanobacterium C42_A2020_066]